MPQVKEKKVKGYIARVEGPGLTEAFKGEVNDKIVQFPQRIVTGKPII